MSKQPSAQYSIPHLREWRIAKLMTQVELATKAKIAVATLSPVENGQTVSLRTLRKLATALGVTPEQLLHDSPKAGKVAV